MTTLPGAILPRLIRLLGYGDKLHCLPYTWNPASKRVQSKSGIALQLVRITMIYTSVYMIAQIISLLTTTASFMERFQGGIFSFVYLSIILFRWEWSPNSDCVQLFSLICSETGNGKNYDFILITRFFIIFETFTFRTWPTPRKRGSSY